MAVPKDTLWQIEPHTQAKHEILRRYLNAWFPILSRWHDKIAYIDGFSGPGRYTGGEPGSPLVALDVAIHHRQALEGEIAFWFMDERQDRIDHLRQELTKRTVPTHFRITIECNRFAENLKQALDNIDQSGLRMAPTFALVDPFGFPSTTSGASRTCPRGSFTSRRGSRDLPEPGFLHRSFKPVMNWTSMA